MKDMFDEGLRIAKQFGLADFAEELRGLKTEVESLNDILPQCKNQEGESGVPQEESTHSNYTDSKPGDVTRVQVEPEVNKMASGANTENGYSNGM